jgi:choline dehydrogenase-like flavoprotein
VDERFRVKGVNQLRVVDASVMPGLHPTNPTATIYMLAERAADVIKEDNWL